MFGPAVGREVLDVELTPRQAVADQARTVLVRLARRIDGRDADQIPGERDRLVCCRLDLGDDAVDRSSGHA